VPSWPSRTRSAIYTASSSTQRSQTRTAACRWCALLLRCAVPCWSARCTAADGGTQVVRPAAAVRCALLTLGPLHLASRCGRALLRSQPGQHALLVLRPLHLAPCCCASVLTSTHERLIILGTYIWSMGKNKAVAAPCWGGLGLGLLLGYLKG